ncbi:hypothetical protein RQP46_008971 [Phenoliferia psychrophenolica]
MERPPSPTPLRQRAQAQVRLAGTDEWIIPTTTRRAEEGDGDESWRVRDDGKEALSTRKRVARVEWAAAVVFGLVAATLRIHRLDEPSAVVFDEVHFGVFSSYYIRREYFFDVHPPLAKLLLAFAAWLAGYDGTFEFENIGDSYVGTGVPYVAMRTLPVIFGTLVPPLVFGTMRASGATAMAAALATVLVLFDNGHVVQTRLIFLDAPLIFFALASVASYIKFSNLREQEFTRPWWTWLCLTGASLGCTISCKMVGLFTFFTIGTFVLPELATILSLRLSLTQSALQPKRFARHFAARGMGLILLPSIIYLACFWVHLAILTETGTGDDFMEIPFQRTLAGNPHLLASDEIRHYDVITMRHRDTKAFLSFGEENPTSNHVFGSVESSGISEWIVEPTRELPATGRGRIVRQHELISLRHRLTNLTLAPLKNSASSFTRFTGLTEEQVARRPNATKFELVMDDAHLGQQWMSKTSQFILIQDETQEVMVVRKHAAVNGVGEGMDVSGTSDLRDDAALFTVDSVSLQPDEAGKTPKPRAAIPLQRLPFLTRFYQLQKLMLEHNAEITDPHPYTSHPSSWPFLLKGISFWTEGRTRAQVYMIGNPIGWWLCAVALASFPCALLVPSPVPLD